MENGKCSGRSPMFIKTLSGDFNQKLLIPPRFVTMHFSEESLRQSSQQVVLKAPSGCSWHVKLNKSNDGIYLQDGWETFVSDHSLQEDELLLFEYDGNMRFRVTIFGTNRCSRQDVLTVKSSQESALMDNLDPNHLSQKLENLEVREEAEPCPEDVAEQRMRRAECSGRSDSDTGSWYWKASFRR